jgi:hypothetical protein
MTDKRMLPSPLWPELPDERTLGERVESFCRSMEQLRAHGLMAYQLLRDQQAEIERLTKLRESDADVIALRAANDSLRRELEAARVDAERYRWLRDTGRIAPFQVRTNTLALWVVDEGFGQRLDAAVDAARARGDEQTSTEGS